MKAHLPTVQAPLVRQVDKGTIYKSIGGFYYVKTAQGSIVECKPRGVFRNRGIRPVAGDKVILSYEDSETIVISEVLERKNKFVRPPVANVDILFIVVSTIEPVPNTLLLDRMTVLAYNSGVVPVIIFTKIDLYSYKELEDIYKKSGIQYIVVKADTGEGLEQIKQIVKGNLCVFSGNSGVGKSTLINGLLPILARETSEISQKLGRGKHTTREVEIFEAFDGLIADTPGFSSLGLETDDLDKENLMYFFPEIKKNLGKCRFSNCKHLAETGCEIHSLVENGSIDRSRYKNYRVLYEELANAEKY